MSRIDEIFSNLHNSNRHALMPFVTGGYPSIEVTEQVLPEIEKAGASIVEIGIPFSDPIADGPVIAASMHDALVAGVTPKMIFDSISRVRSSLNIGLVAMVSMSIVNRIGVESFTKQAAESGFDGLIVPDADTNGGANGPAGLLSRVANSNNLSCSFLISPTTTESRIVEITSICSGFVYLLARVGISGERDTAPEIEDRVKLVRQYTNLPIAAGFGISKPEHVKTVTQSADAAIVGSALVRRMGESNDPLKTASDFVVQLAGGLF